MRAQNSFFKFIHKHLSIIISYVLIITLGIVYLAYSSSGTTTIGENISTTNLTASGNLSVSGNTSLATTTFSGDLDLNLNQLKNLVLEKLSSFPFNPVEGQLFYSTATNTPYWYTGSRWKSDVSGATIVVAAYNSKNKERADYVCDGVADDVEIQAAIDGLPSGGGKVQLLEGTYNISATIILTSNVELVGNGWGTVLNVSEISGGNDAITMADYSTLRDIKIQGSISPLSSNWHKVEAGNHSVIERIWINQNTYGIQATDKSDVHINDCYFTEIRDENGWAAAIHASGAANGIFIDGVDIRDSDRGIEIEDGAKNVFAEHGYLYNIHSDQGGTSFSLDVHSHEGGGGVDNVVFRDFYLERTNGLSASAISGTNDSDKPRNITFENIVIVNPYSITFCSYAYNITYRNIRFHNASDYTLRINEDVENVVISNIEATGSTSDTITLHWNTVNAKVENIYGMPLLVRGTSIKINNVDSKVGIDEGSHVKLSNSKIDASSLNTYAIYIDSDSEDITIENVVVTNANYGALGASGDNYRKITIKDSRFVAGSLMENKYVLDLRNITDLLIDNIKVENYRSYGGIYAVSLTNAVISNSYITADADSPGGYGMFLSGTNTNIHIKNNTILGSSWHAIRAYVSGGGTIENNYIDDDIKIESTSENVNIINNILTSGSIIDNGANTFIQHIDSGNVGVGTITPSSIFHVSNDTATTTITIGNETSGKGACLKLRDSDGAGWTYCSVLDGVLTCGTTSCE